jgi:hypothetical protein
MIGRLWLSVAVVVAVGAAILAPGASLAVGSVDRGEHRAARPAAVAMGLGEEDEDDADDEAAAGQRLDLPAMVPDPADLPDDGYGVSFGESRTLTGYAVYLNDLGGGSTADLADLESELEDAGWSQSYRIWLSLPSEDDPDFFERNIIVELVEYAADAGAEAGYDLIVETYEAAGFEESPGGDGLGDQAVLYRTSGSADTGEAYRWLDLIVQSGPIVAQVSIIDFSNDSPPASEAEEIGEALLARVEAIQEDGSVGLGRSVQRLDGEGVSYNNDWYRRLDGESRIAYGESARDFEADNAWYQENGETDIYQLNQVVPAEDESDPVYVYIVTLVQFEDEDAAEVFIDEQPTLFVESPPAGVSDAELIEDAEEFGDQSALASFVRTRTDGSEANAFEYIVRLGDKVAHVQLNSVADVPQEAVEELARGQIECLEEEGCDFAPVPEALGGTGEADEEDDRDDADDGGEAVEIDLDEIDDSGVRGSATLTADGDETEAAIELRGGEEGMVAVVQEGTCDDLDPDPVGDPAEFDEEGEATLAIPVALEDLLDDEHAIAVYESDDDLEEEPLACGEIAETP